MSNSMTINGVDLGGSNYNLIVEANEFKYHPQPRINRSALASADGDAVQGATFGARMGVVSGVIHAASYADLLTQRGNVEQALAVAQEGAKVVSFDAIPSKQWRCRLVGLAFSNERITTVDVAITLLAPDPWPEATSATTVSGTPISGSPTTI